MTRRAGPGRPADPALTERRKRQIVEAAYKEFAERGYHDTGITEIMQSAELGRGTFYLYFDNKREVLDGVIDFIIEQIMAAIGADVAPTNLSSIDDFADYLRRVGDNLFTLLDEHPTLSTVLIRSGMIDEAVSARIFGLADMFTAVTTMYVARAKQQGILDPTFDTAAIANALTGFAIGGLARGLRGNFAVDERKTYVETAVELMRSFATK
ncbi:TetR/AcrR family transcriptional regulator [Antrihabitans stalactiti]|uniref:TetR/AcrR family transcriptional regulator n=1 Tax=Antrihabitans stalactiti TaxID=2584121 RepID=A0A848K8E0_9NOCA|nr:TetR/AcrR family transcriptional regulator [Antrihabitans stalactiti]NMN94721.1 TetR/AcrR family transcriptional regulator [Antrihabitans stalactiti]